MAVRSVIDIVVNSGAFTRFAQLYNQYARSLPLTVSGWKTVNANVAAVVQNMNQAARTQSLFHLALSATNASMKGFRTSVGQATQGWQTMAKSTQSVASNIKSATESLLRWTGIAAALGGLLGVGSLFGLDHLAAGVGRGRREAEGAGTTYGQQRSFDLTYRRFLDPSFLQNIASVSTNISKSWILGNIGVSRGALRGGDTTAIGNELVPLLKKFVDRTPLNQLQNLSKAYGLDNIVSYSELLRLKSARPGELQGLAGSFAGRAAEFARPPQLEKAYQDLDDALDAAGERIKNVFVLGLEPLLPAIKGLSDTVSQTVANFLRNIKPEAITDFGKGLETFVTYLGSAEFQIKVKELAEGITKLADSVLGFLEKTGAVTPSAPIIGKRPISLKESLNKPGGGGFWDYARGSLVDTGEEVPLPRARPHMEGSQSKPDTNSRIGGKTFEQNAQQNFNDRFYYNNQSSQEVTVTVQSPAGGSVPRAGAMIGSTP